MSSFPLPDNSGITSSPEKLRQTEHSTLPFRPITPSPKEAVDHEPELQAILEEAMEGTGATGAAIAPSAPEGVYCRASIGVPAPEAGTRLRAGIGLTGLCLSTGEILLCNDTNTDRRANSNYAKKRASGRRWYCRLSSMPRWWESSNYCPPIRMRSISIRQLRSVC
jgi:hypothetical protein